jgi:hypothetical protein
MAKDFNRAIKLGGEVTKPGATSVVTVLEYDVDNNVLLATGTTVPTLEAGYALGAIFIKTNGTAGSIRYTNEGSTTSCSFRPTTSSPLTITGTRTILAAESGSTIFIDNATGFVTTLPAPAAGLRYTFINKTANTSGNHTIVTASSSNIIKGNQNSVAGDAGDFGTADDTISFVANQSIAGDKVELFSDGTSWFAYAISKVAAGITFTQAS